MKQAKQRPSGITYVNTKYQALYDKLRGFIMDRDILPTADEFYKEADKFARILKVENCFNASWALRRVVLTEKNGNTRNKKKFQIKISDMGEEFIDIIGR